MSPNENRISSTTTTKLVEDALIKNGIVNGESINAQEQQTVRKDESTEIKIEYVPKIKWLDFFVQIFIHAGGLYGLYLVFTQAKLLTILWGKANNHNLFVLSHNRSVYYFQFYFQSCRFQCFMSLDLPSLQEKYFLSSIFTTFI